MYVNALRKLSYHQVAQLPHSSGFFSFFTVLSTLVRVQQAARAISAALKAVEAVRSCAHWQRRYRSGAIRRRCLAVGFLLRSLRSLESCILSAELSKGLLLLALGTKNDASLPKRRCRDFGTFGVAAYIVAAVLAAGVRAARERCGEIEKIVQSDVCRESPSKA